MSVRKSELWVLFGLQWLVPGLWLVLFLFGLLWLVPGLWLVLFLLVVPAYETTVIPAVIYNMEVMTNVSKIEYDELEKIQKTALTEIYCSTIVAISCSY